MTDATTLPWDDAGTPARTQGDPHARATALAQATMETAATGAGDGSYEREQASYALRLEAMRAESQRAHVEGNNRRALEAAARKAERKAAHEARLAEAAAAARLRREEKAA